jgi:hypothetical protein
LLKFENIFKAKKGKNKKPKRQKKPTEYRSNQKRIREKRKKNEKRNKMGRDPLPLPRGRALIRLAAVREIGLEEV